MTDSGKHIDQKIKTSFDKNQKKAPEGLFETIANSASLSSNEIAIQKSFDKMERKAPSNSWDSVKKQVIIDEVWENITLDQDRRKRRVIWLWFAGSASVVAVILLSILFNSGSTNSSYTEPEMAIKTQSNRNSQNENNTKNGSLDNLNSESKTESSNTVVNQSNSPKRLTVSDEQSSVGNKDISQFNTLKNINRPRTFFTDKDSLRNELIVQNNPSASKKLLNTELAESDLPILGLERLEKSLHDYKLDSNFNLLPKPFKRFEAGLIVGVGNSWLFNNDVKSGFNSSSLVQNKFSGGFNLGVNFNYNLNRRSSLELAYDIYSIHSSRYKFYEDGRLIDQEIQLNQQKITFDYKYRFRKHSFDNGFYVVKGGGYFAHSIKDKTSTSWAKATPSKSFESIDYGLNIGLGSEHSFNSFKVEYGIKSDIGLHNITSSSPELPKKFDYATTFIIGAYVSARYLF